MLKGKPLSSEIAERKRLMGNPQPDNVIKVVAEMFGVDEKKSMAEAKLILRVKQRYILRSGMQVLVMRK
jgi:hypothetical protein